MGPPPRDKLWIRPCNQFGEGGSTPVSISVVEPG